MNMRAAAAEALGTFALTFLVFLSLTIGLPLETPLIAGITLGLFVYIVGGISGAHCNPAVTLGLWSVGKMKPVDVLGYIVAQLVGAIAAMFLGQFLAGGGTELLPHNDLYVVLSEALGACVLLLGISAVVHGKVTQGASGLTIGTALFLGICAASAGSYGVLNPAVAIGIGTISFSYLLAPILGALAGVWIYKGLLGGKKR